MVLDWKDGGGGLEEGRRRWTRRTVEVDWKDDGGGELEERWRWTGRKGVVGMEEHSARL